MALGERRDCREIEEILPWFATDTLRGAEREVVRRHLRDCARCTSELERTVRLLRLLLEAQLDVRTADPSGGVSSGDGRSTQVKTAFALVEGILSEESLVNLGTPSAVAAAFDRLYRAGMYGETLHVLRGPWARLVDLLAA